MNEQNKSTIMYTVIDGYTTLLAEDKQKARMLIEKARDIIKPLINQYNGEWHKDTLSSFSSPVDAVNCALEIQKKLKNDPELNLRIGIHVGDIVFGEADGVKVASGIGSLVEPGGICISDQVYYAVRNQQGIEAEYVGDKTLENVDRPIKVYSLKIREETEAITESSKERPKPSIAVLPFIDMSPGQDQEWFCDGMAEEIINALTHIDDLRVIARTSTFFFKEKDVEISEIGKKLNVETVLEGSVRKAGNKLRITAQLINISDVSHLWSEKYDRNIEDIFAIQDEISLAVVEALKVKLLKKEKAAIVKRYTGDTEAFELYLKGRYFWNRRYTGGLMKGIEYFQQTIEKDPLYALAYTGIADCYNLLGFWGNLPPHDAYTKAKAAAGKALEIDDTLAEAHTSMAWIRTYYDWDWTTAEYEYQRAIALNPNYSTAQEWYAMYIMGLKGQFDEGIAKMKLSLELDPLSFVINGMVGWSLYYGCRYDEAIEQQLKVIEMDPNFQFAYFLLGITYIGKMMWNEALLAHQKSVTLSHELPWTVGYLGMTYALSGQKDEANALLERLNELSKEKYVSSFWKAIIYFGLNEMGKTFEYLEKAYDERESHLAFLKTWHLFARINTDPRFIDLLKKIGLTEK
ncbi:adenylate/guanylate cyclase domain-containing protein [Candidatus Latescibacterota bacterium]